MKGQQEVYNNFRVNPLQGIPNWILPYNLGNQSRFNIFPTNNNNGKTTTLTSDIQFDTTTLPVVSAAGFINNNGRITIGSEKIEYQYKDTTNFYGCVRGVEGTTASFHASGETIKENNIIMYYSRLHEPIILNDDEMVPVTLLERDVEVVDEHMEGVIKAVAYNLLVKIDVERATTYKIDFSELYEQYKADIKRGYYVGRMGTNFREPYFNNESSVPGATNLMF